MPNSSPLLVLITRKLFYFAQHFTCLLKMDRLTEVKKLVRSILIPQKNGYSISQLSEDYVELEGSAIPFQNFGHSSLVEFLKSIDDTVKFFADRLYPVSSETTAHIEKMVQEQRDGGPGRKPKRQSIPHQPLNSKREDPNRVFQSHAPRSREQVPRKYISSSPTRHKSQESLVRGLSRRSPQTYDVGYCRMPPNFSRYTFFFILGSLLRRQSSESRTTQYKRILPCQVSLKVKI